MANYLDLFFGILIGIAAYVLLYIGKGIQKYSIEGLKADKTVKSKNSGIWIFGTVLTASFMFVHWIPLTIFDIPANLIAPLEGLGLITLLIFSYKVLKEPINKKEIIGAILIIIGTVVINLQATEASEPSLSQFNSTTFWVSMAIIFGVEGILVLISKMNDWKFAGVAIGFTAGTFMAFQTLSKRLSDIDELSLIFTFVTFATATLTLVITQIAFSKAKANQVVPCFTSASISFTAIVGYLGLSETIKELQIIGIAIIVIGVIVLSAFQQTVPEVVDDVNDREVQQIAETEEEVGETVE